MKVQQLRSRSALCAVGALLAIGGCDCSDDTPPRALTVVDPVCDSTLTVADDADPAAPGLQYEVIVDTNGLDGELVSLYLDATRPDEDPADGTATASAGEARVTLTLPPGDSRLQARAREGGVTSTVCRVRVEDECASIVFVTPMPEGGTELTLGPAADTDGEMCGEAFETEFVVTTSAPDGAEARIFVNGTPAATTTVDSMIARFQNVPLGGRGTTPNSIRVEIDPAPGVTCPADFPANVFVDCAGPSCIFTAPSTTSAYLSQADDTSDAEGFQTDFVVETDAEGAGQPVRLVIDGDVDGAREVSPVMMGMGAEARFGNVPLTEGVHRVVGECHDDAGNVFRAGPAEWTVDITPCDVTLTDIAGGADPITDLDDLDDTTPGIQVEANGTIAGTDCTAVQVGVCGSLMAATVTDTDFNRTITLGSSATQDICAEVTDEAGNVGTVMVSVEVRTDAPQLEITTPTTGTSYNQMGTGGRTADLDASTDACDIAFTVNCTEVGAPVELVDDSTGAVLGTADCVAMAGLPAPYTGQATFTSVAVPSLDGGGSMPIVARQSVASLVGMSAPVSLTPDCSAPEVTITRPMCGAVLRPSINDEDTSTAGLQYDVQVLNDNVGPPPVTLTIRNSGGSIVYMMTSSLRIGGLHTLFSDADFGSGGDLTVEACATDTAGNAFCTTGCMVMVADLPTLVITQPTDGANLTEAADCDGTATGLQIRVRATTNAVDGSTATVQVGTGTVVSTTASGGVIDVCLDASDGRAVPVRVTVTDATRGMASAMVTVDIDTMAPPTGISDLGATIVDRRGGIVRFTWTSVEDAGGFLLDRYELRCADTAITTEAEWTVADIVPGFTAVPASAGTTQTEDLQGFRAGVPRFCTLRGFDVADRPTPLGNSVDASVAFMQTEVTASLSSQLGAALAAVGDVNGDGINDVVVGAPLATGGVVTPKAYLYFGSTSGLGTSPNVTIVGTHASFGLAVRGVGDFNGDGIADFAIGERGRSGGGAVYLFYGRAAATPWPSTILLTSGACLADVCFVGSGAASTAFFGSSVGSLDFNGDGFTDLVVGAPFLSSLAGRVYVLLGSSGFGANATVSVPLTATITPAASQPAGFWYEDLSARLLGAAVASPGSFVGTAEEDLVAGAVGLTSASIGGRLIALSGRTYPGAAVGLQQISTAVATIDSSTTSGLGEALAISDHNGDGRGDLIAYEATSAGVVYVYPQSATGFSTTTRITVTNDIAGATGDRFGRFLAGAQHPWLGVLGDLDGDGTDEIGVGATERGSEAASADLFYGMPTPTSRVRSDADFVFQPTTALPGVRSVAFLGDITGDGFADIAVGDPNDMSNTGRFYILY